MAVLDIDEMLQSHRQESQWTVWPEIEDQLSQRLEEKSSVTVKGTGDEQFLSLAKTLQTLVFPKLETLRIHWKRLSEVGIVELGTVILMGNLPSLKVLNIANSFKRENWDFGIGDIGLIALTTALGSGSCPSLRSLQIGDFDKSLHDEIIGLQSAKALAELFLLGSLPHLEDLRLNGLRSEEGVVAILTGMEESGKAVSFKKLRLEECEIGFEGALAVVKALHSSNFSALETLNLQDNVGEGLGDDGVVILCTALRSASLNSLQNLWLHSVSMGETGLIELASVLGDRCLPSLKKLYVAGAQHTPASTEAFIEAYKRNSVLTVTIYLRRPTFVASSEESGEWETDEVEDTLEEWEAQLAECRSTNEKLVEDVKRAGANEISNETDADAGAKETSSETKADAGVQGTSQVTAKHRSSDIMRARKTIRLRDGSQAG
ncbi:hypothetical protein R1sor_023685 [Riccia sorocarpa]|uniref:Ran GTPase-activating protein 1 n=1 Tax=Riccia sorocarpa TaxID=122646 RepID=A0ABD3GQN0_9MARC